MGCEPKIDAALARLIYNKMKQSGRDADAALRAAGLCLDDIEKEGSLISRDRHNLLFAAAAESFGDDHFGLHFGSQADSRHFGLISYIGQSSQTIGEAMENLARYIGVTSDRVEVELVRSGDRVEMNFNSPAPADPHQGQGSEAGLALLVNTYRHWADRQIVPIEVRFRHHRPCESRAEFERVFRCPVRFGATTNGVIFKRSDVDLPIVSADKRLLKILRGYCDLLMTNRSRQQAPFLAEVERHTIKLLQRGDVSSANVANEMGLSPRTFSRRLSEAGTSFRRILARIRLGLADVYLQDRSLNINEVAFLLGYTEPTAFNRAYKKLDRTLTQQCQESRRIIGCRPKGLAV